MALNVCGASAAAPAAAEQENCLNVLASKLTNVKVSQLSGLPGGQWQAQPVFPAWAGYVDDTLALNSMFTFHITVARARCMLHRKPVSPALHCL